MEDDDWLPPTEYTLGPFGFVRSNDGFGWTFRIGKRFAYRTRNGTTRMRPRIHFGADENCNRAVTFHCWPLGQVNVWWEPTWRTDSAGPCENCRAELRADGACEWCGAIPCLCGDLRPTTKNA